MGWRLKIENELLNHCRKIKQMSIQKHYAVAVMLHLINDNKNIHHLFEFKTTTEQEAIELAQETILFENTSYKIISIVALQLSRNNSINSMIFD